MKNVLVITPDDAWAEAAALALQTEGFTCQRALTGRAAQLLVSKKEFNYFFLDSRTTDHGPMEILKFLRTKAPKASIFFFLSDKAFYSDSGIDETKLRRSGVTSILSADDQRPLSQYIYDLGKVRQGEAITEVKGLGPESEERAIGDENFSRFLLDELLRDSLTICDVYIRLATDRYVKIFHKGERAETERLARYHAQGVRHLYIPTTDRVLFIESQNTLAEGLRRSGSSKENLKAMKLASEKYIEEALVSGIQPKLVAEGRALCQNMYDTVKFDRNLRTILADFEAFNPTTFSEAFLVMFFSTIICRDLSWVGGKSITILSLGALLHDIGLSKLPPELKEKKPSLMTADELKAWQQHPILGADSLKDVPNIDPGVLLIIEQHHELLTGAGFPLGLSRSKIYPLAKIVALANDFTEFLQDRGLSAVDGLRLFLTDKKRLNGYDPELVANLKSGILGSEKSVA